MDFETTGFDTANDRITEIGVCLWEWETKRPLTTYGIYLWDAGIKEKAGNPEVAGMMEKVCGITPAMLEEFGTDPAANLKWLDSYCERHKIDFIVAHNGENYDKPLLMAELARHGIEAKCLRSIPWIDTRTDLPFASEPDSRKLKHLALDAGFINPFAHRAVFDVLTMMRVLSHYDLSAVLEYQKIPFVTARALVGFEDRQKAKDMRYSWEKLGEKTYPKCWVKRIKENQLEAEIAACNAKGFKIVRID